MKMPKKPGALVVVVQLVILLHIPSTTAQSSCKLESAARVTQTAGTLA